MAVNSRRICWADIVTFATKLDRKGVARLRQEQREFIAIRNRQFGRPDYQLKRELERRLLALRGKAGTD